MVIMIAEVFISSGLVLFGIWLFYHVILNTISKFNTTQIVYGPIEIYYASQTGTSERYANQAKESFNE